MAWGCKGHRLRGASCSSKCASASRSGSSPVCLGISVHRARHRGSSPTTAISLIVKVPCSRPFKCQAFPIRVLARFMVCLVTARRAMKTFTLLLCALPQAFCPRGGSQRNLSFRRDGLSPSPTVQHMGNLSGMTMPKPTSSQRDVAMRSRLLPCPRF